MAAGNWLFFNDALEKIQDGTIRLETDTFRIALLSAAYTFDATDVQWSEISTNEIANGGGYTTHGVAFTFAVSEAGGTVTIDGGDVQWTNMTKSPAPQQAVVVRDADANGALAATDIPICFLDLESGGSVGDLADQTLNVNVHSSGMWTMPVPNS